MKTNTDVKEYSYDLQKLFLEFLISDKEILSRCQNVVKSEYFSRTLQPAAEFIESYVHEYSDCPTSAQIKAVSGIDLNPVSVEHTTSHKEWFLEEFEQFARHKALEKAILTSADLLDKQRYGEVERLIKEASSVGLPKSFGTDYFADPAGRLMFLKNQNGATSTGWKSIDEKLYGGFNRGELNIFAGASGAGKSLFLQNLAINWSNLGLNGVYFSLELSEGLCSMRMDAMNIGIPTKDVFKNIDDVDLKIRMLGKTAGRLQIVQLTAGITVNDLKSWLKEFQIQTGKKIDFVVVDYLDLMMPAGQKISVADLFIKDKLVSEELRAMATQGQYLFCTASQLNRGAVESVEFDHSHISGGLSKIQTADNVIGIFNSITFRERNRVQVQFMKTRSSSAVGTKLELEFDTISLRIRDITDETESVPSAIDTMHANLLRKSTVAQPGTQLQIKKTEPATAIRSFESASKIANILKKP